VLPITPTSAKVGPASAMVQRLSVMPERMMPQLRHMSQGVCRD
jgi:hypothetical protein